jgi:ATP-binding cassette subfamily B protein
MKSLWPLIKPYRFLIAGIVLLALSQNAMYLVLPKIVATSIDKYVHGSFHAGKTALLFLIVLAIMFICLYAQNIVQAVVSERLARDMRKKVLTKISNQRFSFVQTQTSGKLLTNLSSDVDGVKAVTGQIIPVAISSFFLIGGSAVLLFTIDWRLTLVVLAILPILGVVFGVVFSKVGGLFKGAQEVIDRLNRVINESILGAALIRVVHSQHVEYQKFIDANEKAKSFGISILKVFASMIPIIMFVSNIALVVVLVLGGHFVINGTMTIGDLVAFNSYIAILIFPIMMLGFLGSAIARAKASNDRIQEVLNAQEPEEAGLQHNTVKGVIEVNHVTLNYGEKKTLNDISFKISPTSRTAIIGPTAAGKTQLLFAMSGLTSPTSGSVSYDGVPISQYDPKSFYKQWSSKH